MNTGVEQSAPPQGARQTLGIGAFGLVQRIEEECLDDLGADRIASPFFWTRTTLDDRVPLRTNLDDPGVTAPVETAAPGATRQNEGEKGGDSEDGHPDRLDDDPCRAQAIE